MQINEVIRKYRKEKNMTQEEMANRLGVTAPAVNKWESGASTPDISLLAPIARLLHITLDELLSFNENLTDMEVSNIVNEIYGMLATHPIDTVYEKIVGIVREYPNAENLILSLATVLYSRSLILPKDERTKYDEWIQNNLENLLLSSDEFIKTRAVDSLYAFFISRECYDEAEKCLEYISPDDPDRKRKLATIYKGTGKYEEAYTILEEAMLTTYQSLSVIMHEIHTIAIKTGNYKKAETLIQKESALSDIFDMGAFDRLAVEIELTTALKDAEKTLALMDSLLSTTDSLMEFTKSDLFEHMTFNEQVADDEKRKAAADMVKSTQLKSFCEDDAYQFVRESAGWDAFRKKWRKFDYNQV